MSLPRVSTIITAYRESARPYLELCVRSVNLLAHESHVPHQRFIVAPSAYAPEYADWTTLVPGESYGMPRGLNFGIDHAFENGADFCLVLNDDVVMTRHSLDRMVFAAENYPAIGIMMPIGNDTNLNRYALRTPIVGPYRMEQLNDYQRGQMLSANSPYPDGLIFCDTLCLYAFLIHKSTWEKVGKFDEGLLNSDDIDYSLRSRQAGYLNALCLSSLVFHAGGASNSLTDAQRAQGAKLFNDKWRCG